jgi:anti-sigma B factor antagonist
MATQDARVYDAGPLRISEERDGERLTIAVEGELDIASAPDLDAALQRAEDSDAVQIILDLSMIRFIDSTGLGALLVAGRRSTEDGSRLGMRLGSGEVARMMKLTAIDQTVTIVD